MKRILLFPISLLYGLITALRNLCYDWGILKSYNFREHVISVGNLAVGGTGKSPHIEYLNQLLKDQFSVANLSRGYSRKTRGYMEVFAENTAEEVGDEPKQFKTKFPDISVAVDADRLRGIKQLLKKKPKPEIILLDDAFQHRRVKPGLNILLTDFRNLFVNDSMLPGGFLREYPSNYRRADIIIITKTPERITHLDLKVYSKEINLLPHQKLRFEYGSQYAAPSLSHLSSAEKKQSRARRQSHHAAWHAHNQLPRAQASDFQKPTRNLHHGLKAIEQALQPFLFWRAHQ